jgi:hypothetical protein
MSLKKSSSLLNLGSRATFTDGDTNATTTISLPLNTLDREVFVVTDIQFDYDPPIVPQLPGQNVSLNVSVNKTAETVQTINSPNCISHLRVQVTTTPVSDTVQATTLPNESSSGTSMDYIAIIATPDYNIVGSYASTGGGDPDRSVYVRLTGYRAVASSDIYAALVTEELNQ